jgi:carbon-monoxide dehydrogenase medium subunit
MDYVRPSSLKEAVDRLGVSGGNAFVLAGGSDLLVRMRGGLIDPSVVVDIKGIKELG